jgi:phospholipase/carboxylesterase
LTTLSGPMLMPRSGRAPKQAVVLLHGYGADGSDLISLAGAWQDLLPEAAFVAPNAPEPVPGMPFGFQWFPLDLERPETRLLGLPLARPVLVQFLEALWTQTGITAGDTLLAGFSQGAMMALHVGVSLEKPPMGIIALSGAFVPPQGFGAADREPKPPICLIHGDMDTIVDPNLSTEAAATLEQHGYDVRHHVSRGVGHGISTDGLEFASRFIADITPDR